METNRLINNFQNLDLDWKKKKNNNGICSANVIQLDKLKLINVVFIIKLFLSRCPLTYQKVLQTSLKYTSSTWKFILLIEDVYFKNRNRTQNLPARLSYLHLFITMNKYIKKKILIRKKKFCTNYLSLFWFLQK